MNLRYNPWFSFLLVVFSRQKLKHEEIDMNNKIFVVCVHLFSYAWKNNFRNLDADFFLTTFFPHIKPTTNTVNFFTEKDCFVFQKAIRLFTSCILATLWLQKENFSIPEPYRRNVLNFLSVLSKKICFITATATE